MKMEKWRIDDSYEKIYKYNKESDAYVFYSSFYGVGITSNMPESKQIKIIEEDYYDNLK